MKYTLPMAIGAIGLLLGSCASERTTFVKGNTIEWQAKNAPAPQSSPTMVAPVAITPEETASVPEEINTPVVQASEEVTASVDNAILTEAEIRPVSAFRAKSEEVEMPVTVVASEQGVQEAATSATASPAVPVGGSKNQTLAAVLAFFLGGLGVHRFYLGYTWQGVVQLLTGGGLIIWALIDFVRICIGSLEPKDGSYN